MKCGKANLQHGCIYDCISLSVVLSAKVHFCPCSDCSIVSECVNWSAILYTNRTLFVLVVLKHLLKSFHKDAPVGLPIADQLESPSIASFAAGRYIPTI